MACYNSPRKTRKPILNKSMLCENMCMSSSQRPYANIVYGLCHTCDIMVLSRDMLLLLDRPVLKGSDQHSRT